MVTLKTWEPVKDDDNTLSFKTYRNYINSIARIIIKTYGEDYLIELKKILPSVQKASSKRDFEKIKSLLINCWHTELNFILPTKIETGLTKYSFHWAPVQIYYSLYLALRCLFESNGMSIKNTHEPTLRSISSWICDRDIFPYPLNCNCCGLSELKNICLNNFQCDLTNEEINQISALAMPDEDNLEKYFAKFLKTTREKWFISKKERSGLKTKTGKKLKRFTIEHKKKVDEKMHNTTIFDCLYRLRIKSNYEDAETYILSQMSSSDADELYDSLKIILNCSLFCIENLIKGYLGEEEFNKIIK